ncbi:MAG: ATP-dependent DNA helicase, partial [Cyanobacteria bacterium HKST-UBA06]|nr:ATP-dependent DNA helicase [Cyanobacteria bacterium HKST-UBA06]
MTATEPVLDLGDASGRHEVPVSDTRGAVSSVPGSLPLANVRLVMEAVLAQLPTAEVRPSQLEMANVVATALANQETAIVEAGTGSGKSLAYLVPALESSTRPIVISTGTIALQEQLLHKDIPFVLDAVGRGDVQVRLVKGRRNYLCIQKMLEFERQLGESAPQRLYTKYLKSELNQGWDGDRANLDMEVPPEIWSEVESDSEDCLNQKCAYFHENPYRQARQGIDKAQILIVNHALYLMDLMTGQGVLPSHDTVIIDEAHQFKGVAQQAFTERIGKYATQKLIRKIHRRLMPVPEDVQRLIIETEARLLDWLFRFDKPVFKIVPDDIFLDLVDQQLDALMTLRQWIGAVDVKQLPLDQIELGAKNAPSLKPDADGELGESLQKLIETMAAQRTKLVDQLDGLIARWEYFTADGGALQDPGLAERVNWAEVKRDKLYFELKSTPLDLAETLAERLWADKSAVLTSATLSTNRQLGSYRRSLGLPADEAGLDRMLASPFDYQRQCRLYLPLDMPDPNDELYTAAVVKEVVKLLRLSQGRAFVLFTSIRAMQATCASVVPQITYPAKMQGDLPKNRLIEWFKETDNSVLFATATFWEGVDVPGDDLSCVIMDRLPFAPPDDPVHAAVVERMKRLGQNWFGDYVLPETAIRLKQGFGRLIRSKTDSGI